MSKQTKEASDKAQFPASAHLSPDILGSLLNEEAYRRYVLPQYRNHAITKLHDHFTGSKDNLVERQKMLNGYENLCHAIQSSTYPVQAAFDFIKNYSQLANSQLANPTPNTLGMHLKEVAEFARAFLLESGNSSTSRFPHLLTDRQAVLVAHVAAPLHDLLKYLGTPQAQIMPDHEIMAAELIRNHFNAKKIDIPKIGEITFNTADCDFLSALIGDHENIEKEQGRTNFISSSNAVERAKGVFFILDTLTGVIKKDGESNTWMCDEAQLDARFTDLVYRHIDQVSGKIFRPQWALITVRDLSYTVSQFANHGVQVCGTSTDESFEHALIKSALRAIDRALAEDNARRELNPPQILFNKKDLRTILATKGELERTL